MLALAHQRSLEHAWPYASAFLNLYWYYGLAGWVAGRATVPTTSKMVLSLILLN